MKHCFPFAPQNEATPLTLRHEALAPRVRIGQANILRILRLSSTPDIFPQGRNAAPFYAKSEPSRVPGSDLTKNARAFFMFFVSPGWRQCASSHRSRRFPDGPSGRISRDQETEKTRCFGFHPNWDPLQWEGPFPIFSRSCVIQ